MPSLSAKALTSQEKDQKNSSKLPDNLPCGPTTNEANLWQLKSCRVFVHGETKMMVSKRFSKICINIYDVIRKQIIFYD